MYEEIAYFVAADSAGHQHVVRSVTPVTLTQTSSGQRMAKEAPRYELEADGCEVFYVAEDEYDFREGQQMVRLKAIDSDQQPAK